jgi:hypothetical protein
MSRRPRTTSLIRGVGPFSAPASTLGHSPNEAMNPPKNSALPAAPRAGFQVPTAESQRRRCIKHGKRTYRHIFNSVKAMRFTDLEESTSTKLVKATGVRISV